VTCCKRPSRPTICCGAGKSTGQHQGRGSGAIVEANRREVTLSTGEMLPAGQSLNSRFLGMEIDEGEILDPTILRRWTNQ